tara:strand:+ start:6105 stop:6230 length:126 start_codon:yes stop_codon:yes gene_type:complete
MFREEVGHVEARVEIRGWLEIVDKPIGICRESLVVGVVRAW